MRAEVPSDLVERIREAARLGNYFIVDHAYKRMKQRQVNASDIRQVLLEGEPIEYDRPGAGSGGAGLLFAGEGADRRPLHVKAAEQERARRRYVVITVYEPDPDLWEPGFKLRKKEGEP